ncbi:MAG: glycosyltransferase [Variovorax sp.]|jgi:UDP-D-galactose:(glucosyl)LPS alpha-1,6-D-galactosyltransferase|nr:MAG: glycosyltransferase [Variovorax sp.]
MDILLVVGTLSGRGGIETCVRSLAEQAQAHGDHVRVLALCPSTVDPAWHEGLDYAEVEHGSPSLKRQMLRGLPAVVGACRKFRPDVVVVIYGSSVPLVRAALVLAGLRRPVMAWLHFSTVLKQRTSLLRYAHGHMCISPAIAEATRAIPGVRGDSVHLVYNGTRLDTAVPIPRSSGGPLRIVHVGRLMVGRQKRTDDLLQALSKVEGDWRLDLVGVGENDQDTVELKAMAERFGFADRIAWLGWQTDPWAALPVADLLVLCSAFEGFVMVLIEAMARGIPCISSDCSSGPADVIREGENGWLYPTEDCDALAGRIQAVIDDRGVLPPPDTVRTSIAMFSSEKVYLRIRQALESTIDRHAGRATHASPT